MSTFKIVLISVFSVAIIASLILFALSENTIFKNTVEVNVWGTIDKEIFDRAYQNSSIASNKLLKVNYVRKDAADFEAEFVEALAEGNGPDVVFLRDDAVYKNQNKLLTIPYKNYSQRDFKDRFIEEGELFLTSDGVIALPFMVDPLVMYWNRDIFSNNVISQPPQYWDQIYSIIEKTTRRDNNANILQSTIALGEWRNIVNAKEIIAMILMQAGTPITSRQDSEVVSVLNSIFNYPVAPSQSAINFYTQFSNPTGPAYTWNRSLPSSLNMFLSGSLAMYLGFSSEIFSIQQKNSNLNFDVTYVPQIRGAAKKTVFGHMYVLAIVKQSKQVAGAFSTVVGLTEPAALKSLESVTNLPPVRRDLLAEKPTEAFRTVFFNSALISRSFIDPDKVGTANTFRDMIESITGGKNRVSEALNQADDALNSMLK
jgi:ABC-type glycerol-3-phosphate transport system substrate-binding protein